MSVYLFCISCLTFSFSLHLIHLLYFLSSGFKCFQSLCIAWMEPWTGTDHLKIFATFLSQKICWLWREHCCCSTHSAYLLLMLLKNNPGSSCKSNTRYCFLLLALVKTLIWSLLLYSVYWVLPNLFKVQYCNKSPFKELFISIFWIDHSFLLGYPFR